MNKILKLAICTGIISPFCASAQLITVSEPSTSASFNALVALMAADEAALGTGAGEANASIFSEVHWDTDANVWVTGSLSNDNNDLNFELIDVNFKYFLQTGQNIDIGFVGNENWDLDELFVNAYALGDLGNSDPRVSLFDYSDNAPANDFPGDTARLTLTPNTQAPVVLEFEHINQTSSPLGPLYQSSEIRFKMYRGVNVDGNGAITSYKNDEWLFGINDRNKNFDKDSDDGYFFINGDIRPVPEPSQIAALSLLGLGALLVIRRRIVKRRK